MRLLDLDDEGTWLDAYVAYVEGDFLINKCRDIADSSADFYRVLIEKLDKSNPGGVESPFYEAWCGCVAKLEADYTHVSAVHLCRPNDLCSYERDGLCGSDVEGIIRQAEELFGDVGQVRNAVMDIQKTCDYLGHNRGKVGFLMSESYIRKCKDYLGRGSELLSAIANRLGKEVVLRARGVPTVVKCALPIEWLDRRMTFRMKGAYAVAPVIEVLKRKLMGDEYELEVEGGFMLNGDVPRELILQFIDGDKYLA